MKTQAKRARKKTLVVQTSHSAQLVKQWRRMQQAIVLRVNDGMVLQVNDERSVHMLAHLVERLESIAAIQQGLDDVNQGRTMSFDEFQAKARAKHGLPH